MFIRLLCQTCVSSQNGLALSCAAPPAAGPGCSRAARSSGSCRRCRRFATRWRFAGASGSPAAGSAARFAAPRRWRRRTGSLRELWLVVRRRRCRCGGDGVLAGRPQVGGWWGTGSCAASAPAAASTASISAPRADAKSSTRSASGSSMTAALCSVSPVGQRHPKNPAPPQAPGAGRQNAQNAVRRAALRPAVRNPL